MTIDGNSDVHENNEQQQKFADLLSKVESLDPEDYWLESIDSVITTDFCNYLEGNSWEAAKDLLSAVDRALWEHPHDNSLNQLKLILTPIANPMNMDDISWEKGKDYNWRKWKIENLKDTREELNSLLDEKMKDLDQNDSLYKTLNNIKTVVNNWDSKDVGRLQQFLYHNLPLDKQRDFLNNNFRFVDGARSTLHPDWMFGQSVAKWIEDFLRGERLNSYIEGVKVSKEMQKKADGQIQIESTDISDDLNSEKPEDVDNGWTEVVSNKAEQPVTTGEVPLEITTSAGEEPVEDWENEAYDNYVENLNSEKPEDVDNGWTEVVSNKAEQPVTTGEVPPEITTTTETGTLAGSTVYEQNDVPNEGNSFSGA